jgi:LPXTG-motif cell wall-anchored protein
MIMLITILGLASIGFGIWYFLRRKKNILHKHSWEVVEGGNENKAALVYCSGCGEFSIREWCCESKHCDNVFRNPHFSSNAGSHRHSDGYYFSGSYYCNYIPFYRSKEETETIMYRDYPEYTKYIRSPLYDSHNLDKQLEEHDPLLEQFKVLEEKMNKKKNFVKARIESKQPVQEQEIENSNEKQKSKSRY